MMDWESDGNMHTHTVPPIVARLYNSDQTQRKNPLRKRRHAKMRMNTTEAWGPRMMDDEAKCEKWRNGQIKHL